MTHSVLPALAVGAIVGVVLTGVGWFWLQVTHFRRRIKDDITRRQRVLVWRHFPYVARVNTDWRYLLTYGLPRIVTTSALAAVVALVLFHGVIGVVHL